jgi:hypothetical protein
MKDNHPAHALKVPFQPLNGKRVKYWVWNVGNEYYWSCLGASGKEKTMEAAMRAAREYVLYGVSGMPSLRTYRGVLDESRSQSN